MGSKLCRKCGLEKSLSNFVSNGPGRPLYSTCKSCKSTYNKTRWQEVKHTVESIASNMASTLRQRLKGERERGNTCYTGVKCFIGDGSRKEIKAYILTHFSDDIQKLLDKDETPSLDRIDAKKHYEPGNLRIIPWRDNTLRGQKRLVELVRKGIKVTYPSGETRAFLSILEASTELKCSRNTIKEALKGNCSNRKGYTFELL